MKHNAFLSWIDEWVNNLPKKNLQELGDPNSIALVSVDMIVGFCHQGALASSTVRAIIPEVVSVFNSCHTYGVEHFLLIQDAHTEHATEFGQFPPHCQKGSEEAKTIPEIAELGARSSSSAKATANKQESGSQEPACAGRSGVRFEVFEKNSLSIAYSEAFEAWVKKHPEVVTFIVVGNCTDLCVYSMAMHLKLSANATDKKRSIIIPASAVSTYDLPVKLAKQLGAIPHDQSILDPLFLYHMMLNGIEIVSILT